MQEHKLFPICYASKKLSDAELNYSTIEKEHLAVVWGIKRLHMYLYGVRFGELASTTPTTVSVVSCLLVALSTNVCFTTPLATDY